MTRDRGVKGTVRRERTVRGTVPRVRSYNYTVLLDPSDTDEMPRERSGNGTGPKLVPVTVPHPANAAETLTCPGTASVKVR